MGQFTKTFSKFLFLGFCLFNFVFAPAAAADWPEKPVRLIVPYPPGGGTDLVARLLSTELSKQLGQNVIVENKPGGNTIIGTGVLAQAKPDGYTFGLVTDSHVINPHIMESIPYEIENDFVNVAQLVNVPFVLVASKGIGVSTIEELVAKAKEAPGTINYASPGSGSPHYLAMEWFANVADIDITHIPYTGVGPALAALGGGQVDLMFTGLSTGLPQVADGRLVALGVSTKQPSEGAPDVVAIAESGYPDFTFITWYGIVAPKDTPADITTAMSKEIKLAMQQPAIKEKLLALGVLEAASTPEEFTEFIQDSAKQYDQIFALIERAEQRTE